MGFFNTCEFGDEAAEGLSELFVMKPRMLSFATGSSRSWIAFSVAVLEAGSCTTPVQSEAHRGDGEQ